MFKKRVIKDSRVSKRKIGDINEASEDAPDTQVTKKEYPHHQEVRHTEKIGGDAPIITTNPFVQIF